MRLWQAAAFVLTLLLWITTADAKTGKSYSGGGSKSYSSGKSYSGSKSTSNSSGKSYSGGSKTTSNTGKSYSGGNTSGKSVPSKNTSSGNSYSSGGGNSYSRPSIKPAKTNFDSLGTKEQMKVESRNLYNQGTTSRTSYKTSSGKTATIDPKDAKINQLRSQLTHERWVNREYRQQQFYGSYYTRPVVIYNDPYPSFFWWWLLDRSLEERALWAYHHRQQMDAARYNALLAKDAQLEARIRQLEAQGVARDPKYTPAGMDTDLMYSNEYVDAVYNPAPTVHDGDSTGFWVFLQVLFWIFLICLVVFMVWFVFFNRSF